MTPPDEKKPSTRRVRYRGTHPRRFGEKYKELDPERDPETIAKVIASGKTPAGQHRPILVNEIVEQLAPRPGERGADVTLGYGGHTEALLPRIAPGGHLLALDVDPEQLPRTASRLRGLGYGKEILETRRANYAEFSEILKQIGWRDGVDFLLADLGVSAMQIDDPARGFSYKHDGPLDMRMDNESHVSARDWLMHCTVDKLTRVLEEGGDERYAKLLAEAIKATDPRTPIESTGQLRKIIERACPKHLDEEQRGTTLARVFQAIRIAVNDEFGALDAFLDRLPDCLRPGGRVALLSFHSGEDRRVKGHLRDGFRGGLYSEIASEIVRPSYDEIGGNPRAVSAKMRWARKTQE